MIPLHKNLKIYEHPKYDDLDEQMYKKHIYFFHFTNSDIYIHPHNTFLVCVISIL